MVLPYYVTMLLGLLVYQSVYDIISLHTAHWLINGVIKQCNYMVYPLDITQGVLDILSRFGYKIIKSLLFLPFFLLHEAAAAADEYTGLFF